MNLYHLKELSVFYFFLHPIFIEISFYLLKETNFSKWHKGQIVACTYYSFDLYLIRNYFKNPLRQYIFKEK